MELTAKLQRKRRLKEAKAIADQMTYESNETLCRKMDGLWLYTMHMVFGFGKKRLTRLYWAMIEEYIQVMRKYRYEDDDSHWFAIERHLREYVGIDVKELQAEADRRYPHGAGAEARKENNNG